MTQICKKCNATKPLSEFEIVNKKKGWIRHECRECVKNRLRKWALDSIDHIRAYQKEYCKEHSNIAKKRASRWNIDNAEKHRTHCMTHYHRLQHQVMLAYGGYKCNCCGETEPLFLSLDHVNNDGKQHRESIGVPRGMQTYRWIIKNNYPPIFQVLCMNCNHGKHRNHGICPHQKS